MKKLIVFAMMAAAATLASCSKNTEIDTTEVIHSDGPQVRLTLGTDDPATRAFFDNTASAEVWENEVKSLTIYAFDKSGSLITKRSLSAAEVSARSATFSLPNSAGNTDCSFYVVANADYGDVSTTGGIDALTEKNALNEYNGAFGDVTRGRKRAAGFVMTGKTKMRVALPGSITSVPVTLKRVVAKVALRVKVDPSFAANYGGGTVTINSARLSRASSASNLFYKAGSYAPRTSLYEISQVPQIAGGYTDALFYIYENGALNAGSRVLLTLSGVFDGDGNASTTGDRLPTEFKIDLDGSGGGEIRRNGYYRVEATIKGLSGDGAAVVSVTVADWETPVTQTITLGN